MTFLVQRCWPWRKCITRVDSTHIRNIIAKSWGLTRRVFPCRIFSSLPRTVLYLNGLNVCAWTPVGLHFRVVAWPVFWLRRVLLCCFPLGSWTDVYHKRHLVLTTFHMFECVPSSQTVLSHNVRICVLKHIIMNVKQEVKVIWQKAPHGGPIPRLGVTPGGRKLYHWIPGVGFPISVP